MPEMMEGYPRHRILAIQSHPEIFTVHGDKVMPRFFQFLIQEATQYHRQKTAKAAPQRRKAVRRKK